MKGHEEPRRLQLVDVTEAFTGPALVDVDRDAAVYVTTS